MEPPVPRQPRIQFPGAIQHITVRGDRREKVFIDDNDRHIWLRIFADVCQRYGWHTHAFCQMGNHYHLVIETPEPNLSAGMLRLNSIYTQRFNYRHSGSGHLFQSRFHSQLVQRQTHLLELIRYVILNPVRAGMVATPGGWPWSSYAMTCSPEIAPAWLDTDWVLAQFADQPAEAVKAFRRFVADGCGKAGDRPAGPVPAEIEVAGG